VCGIFGIASTEEISGKLLRSLELLEYRGYDSCGLSYFDEEGHLQVRKGTGPVKQVAEEEQFSLVSGRTGLGHVRWATHGRVSRLNAHPLTDSFGDLAIVHNGILQDYQQLRDQLTEEGHTFLSETDSEVKRKLRAMRNPAVQSSGANEGRMVPEQNGSQSPRVRSNQGTNQHYWVGRRRGEATAG